MTEFIESKNKSEGINHFYRETFKSVLKRIKRNVRERFPNSNVNKFPVIYVYPKKEEILKTYFWNYIYLTIDGHPYWLFKWEKGRYILQDHKDGNKELILEKGKKYALVLKDFLFSTNIDFNKELKEIKTNQDIKEAFKKFVVFDRLSEKIEPRVEKYVANLLEKIWYNLGNRYISYIDNKYNRLFLFYVDNNKLEFLWYDKVSTWNPKRGKKYHQTPYLIIDREKLKLYNRDWYAEWIDRKWYWPKWSRIYFLWKYFISKNGSVSLHHKAWYKEIHLAFHTTTPWGLTQLWKPMSMWCIRTSRFINVLYNLNSKINRWVFIIWDLEKKIVPQNIVKMISESNNLAVKK